MQNYPFPIAVRQSLIKLKIFCRAAEENHPSLSILNSPFSTDVNLGVYKLIDVVLKTIKENQMLKENDKVIAAVSGGPDSMCLLHILNTYKEHLKIDLTVAHVNHCLRGAEADEDEDFVRRFCEKLNIEFYSIKADINKLSSEKNISSEMAGRIARYEFFENIKNKTGANKIALAHNANDRAETILMRIMRGTGLDGLVGIKPVRNEVYIRPLINVNRDQIEAYCEENKLNARIDKTNLQNIYSRNKVRLELIPYIMENFNKDIVNTLNRLSDTVRIDSEYLDNISKKIYKLYCEKKEEKVIIKRDMFFEHNAVLTRVIRMAIENLAGSTYNIEKKHILDIIDIQKHKTGVEISLPNHINVYNNYGDIKIYYAKDKNDKDLNEYSLYLDKNNIIENQNYAVKLKIIDNNENINLRKNQFMKYFDYDKISGKITLRYRRNGDRFTSIGMAGEKKLKDIFIDMKVDKTKRDHIPLICFHGEIAWIVGYKVSDKFKVDKNTKKILEIKFESEEV